MCCFFCGLSDSSLFSTLFSGVIGTVIASVVSVLILKSQLKTNAKSENFANLLKLKEMFASDKYWYVYKYFQGKKNNPECEEDELNCRINDYLGLYEIAYGMYNQSQISEDDFFNIFFYRIYNLSQNKRVQNKILREFLYWKKLFELILKNIEWGYKHRRIQKDDRDELIEIYKNIKFEVSAE